MATWNYTNITEGTWEHVVVDLGPMRILGPEPVDAQCVANTPCVLVTESARAGTYKSTRVRWHLLFKSIGTDAAIKHYFNTLAVQFGVLLQCVTLYFLIYIKGVLVRNPLSMLLQVSSRAARRSGPGCSQLVCAVQKTFPPGEGLTHVRAAGRCSGCIHVCRHPGSRRLVKRSADAFVEFEAS